MRRFRAQHEQLAITPSNADRAIAARPIEQGGELLPRFGVGELFHLGECLGAVRPVTYSPTVPAAGLPAW